MVYSKHKLGSFPQNLQILPWITIETPLNPKRAKGYTGLAEVTVCQIKHTFSTNPKYTPSALTSTPGLRIRLPGLTFASHGNFTMGWEEGYERFDFEPSCVESDSCQKRVGHVAVGLVYHPVIVTVTNEGLGFPNQNME